MTSMTAQLGEPIRDAPGAPGLRIPGYTGQGWSTHETMLIVRWLFAHPDVWEQAMDAARDPVSNPHTVADTLHEQLVPRAELDQIAGQGFDPAKVNWLEIAHELIERRNDPQPAGVTPGTIGAQLATPMTITGQVSQHAGLASGPEMASPDTISEQLSPAAGSWPYPGVATVHALVAALGLGGEPAGQQESAVRQFMQTPAWDAAPPVLQRDVRRWLGLLWMTQAELSITRQAVSLTDGGGETITAQMANPVTIGGQLASTISGQLELAGGWRDAWRHEFRDAHGRWTRTPGEQAADEDIRGAAREVTPARASDLSEGDRVMLPHPVTGDLAPGTITEHRDVGDRVELDVRRADSSVDTANLDRSEVVDRIDSDVEPEQFPDEVDTGDDEKPPPVVPKPAPPRVLLARPALYTYQRQKIVALGLDADHSQPSDVRQAAARVRLRMPLTADQSAALAGALRAQAGSSGVRPVQARALERAAHRFDAAAAEVHGSASPVFDGGRVSAVSTDARDMTEGDTIALARPDGTIGVVTVRGIRPSMGGRVITMDLEHQDGTRETRVLTGRTKGWLLPDKADDEPVPPPGDRREHITPDQLRVGDEIALDNAGLPGKTGPVTSIEPEGNGYRVGFTDGHRLYSGLLQSYDGGPAVIRTARGPASQDQPWDSVMQAEHPERIDPAEMRVGDRVRLGQGPDAATGVIHSIERSPSESGGDGYLVGLRADNSETSGVFVAPGERGVTRLVKGDDNAAERIAAAKAERLRAQRAQVIRDVLDRVIADQRAGDQGALGIAIGHPSDDVLKNALSQSAPSPHNAREAATRIRQMIAPMLHDSGGAEAEKLAEDRIVPVLMEIAQRDHDNFVRSLLNATAGLWDPENPNASRNITRARQRVLEQWRGSPPPTDTGQVSRALAAVADAMTEASGEEAVNSRPGVPVLPEGTDLAARVAAYRAALPAPEHIGKKQVTRAMFAQPHLADLEAGRVPPVTRETMGVPDVAEDGGPGHTAMRHLDIVMAAGKDLDAELQKRITATLGMTPQKQARHEAAAARLSDIGRERMALYREEKEASDAAGDARARELGYPNLMGLSVKARVTGGTPEVRAHYDDALAAAAAARKQVRDKMDALKAERKQLEATDLISDKARADAQREAALQLLAQVRADGLGGVKLTYRQATGKQSVMSERSELVQAMRFAEGNYPTAWLAKARDRGTPFASATAPGGTERAYRLGTVTRGHYQDRKREIRLSKDSAEKVTGGGERARVATHELGHAMEQAVPGLLPLQHSYLWSRTSSGEIGSRKHEKKAMIYAGEYGYRDTLPLHYTGKDYGNPDAATVFSNPNVAFEVLTTGAESLFAGSEYLDDSFRQWLLGTLATV